MSGFATVHLRADPKTAATARFVGNEGINVLLMAHLAQNAAEQAAGVDDLECWRHLFMSLHLRELVRELVEAKNNIIDAINGMEGDAR